MKKLIVYILVWLTMNAIVGDYGAPGVRGVEAVGLPVSPGALFRIYKSGVDKLWPAAPEPAAPEAKVEEEDADSWGKWQNPSIPDALDKVAEGVEAARAELEAQLEVPPEEERL